MPCTVRCLPQHNPVLLHSQVTLDAAKCLVFMGACVIGHLSRPHGWLMLMSQALAHVTSMPALRLLQSQTGHSEGLESAHGGDVPKLLPLTAPGMLRCASV